MIEQLKNILMKDSELTVDYLDKHKNEIFNIIPELKDEDGFDQKSPWHIYDVWKHTEVALAMSNHDFEERLALLLHDIGKPHCYQNDEEVRHFRGHAQKSAEISEGILKRLGVDEIEASRIIYLIENHSTIIDTNSISMNNIGLAKKLLNIQYCDTKAYNPNKIEPVINRLDGIRKCIESKEADFYLEK